MRLFFAWVVGIIGAFVIEDILRSCCPSYCYSIARAITAIIISARIGMAIYHKELNAKVSLKGNIECIVAVPYSFLVGFLCTLLEKLKLYDSVAVALGTVCTFVFLYCFIFITEKIAKYYDKS